MFWTADSLATRLGLMVDHHKPECFVKKMDYCVQGQGHSDGSKCRWLFIQSASSEPLNSLLLNLVRWCIIISQSVFQKDWFAVFMVKVTIKDHIIKVSLSYISSEVLILRQLSLVRWHIIIKSGLSCEKNGFLCCGQGQDHGTGSEFQWMFIWAISPQLLNLL